MPYSLILQKHFLNWGSLLSDDSSLCQFDIKYPVQHQSKKRESKMSWVEKMLHPTQLRRCSILHSWEDAPSYTVVLQNQRGPERWHRVPNILDTQTWWSEFKPQYQTNKTNGHGCLWLHTWLLSWPVMATHVSAIRVWGVGKSQESG